MSILRDFYDGNLFPRERVIPPDAEYRSLAITIGEGREHFKEQLPEEDKERFEKWNEQINEYEGMLEYGNFSCGFKLGIILAFEIFTGRELG